VHDVTLFLPFIHQYVQSRVRTNAVLVIGLYKLLGNATTKLIEPPGPLTHLKSILYYPSIDTTWVINQIYPKKVGIQVTRSMS
jgi:hypothetical protein